MRWLFASVILSGWLGLCVPAAAANGKVIKVLPHFLDLQGRHALSPSLYERDAYQAILRQRPEQRSGMRFDIHWKARRPVWQPLRLRLELRGLAQGELPRRKVLEQYVRPTGWFGRWTPIELTGADYREFGEVTAWRVSLWEGDRLLDQETSFLW